MRAEGLRVGLAGIGLEAYWSQFEGLEERLRGYLGEVRRKIEGGNRTIVNLGLVDSHAKAIDAGHACRQQDIDILLVYVTTYALSANILPVILRAQVPVVLLNLQPEAAIDYARFNAMGSRAEMTGEWLAYCSACPVPEIANVLRRLEIPFQQVTGVLHDDSVCWAVIEEWLIAAEIAKTLSHSRMGLMGHYYGGMLDIATDLVQVSGRFGAHVEIVEVDQLSALRREVTEQQTAARLKEFHSFFTIDEDCSREELDRAATTAAALDRMIADNALDMLAYYYMGSGIAENENTMSSIILGASMLTAKGVPIAGEYEIKNVLAMKIMDALGAGGSFTEYYAMDFNEDLVLMGHDGPGHARIAQNRIRVRPLKVYHGKVGRGLSVEMAVKHGPVTLLSVVEDKDRGFCLLAAEGESVEGPVLEIGNTNSRYRFPLGARGFVEAWSACGPAHHCAIGIGHRGSQLRKLAELMGLGFHQVC
ncbi:MAG: arabinose isomerase [Acidobacteria bacterium]|nr:arabinose isomerase [Acidobacteriota bacterium]